MGKWNGLTEPLRKVLPYLWNNMLQHGKSLYLLFHGPIIQVLTHKRDSHRFI